MSAKVVKPIKKWDMITTYVLGAVGQLLTVIMWFPVTLKAEYFSSSLLFNGAREFDITLFTVNENLPMLTNIINAAFLLLSIVCLAYFALPLIKKTVMKPHNFVFPAAFNLAYVLLYLIRYFNAIKTFPLYDIVLTPVFYAYLFGIAASFATAISIVICTPRLKKQLEQDTDVYA